jgi:hypothetical protein
MLMQGARSAVLILGGSFELLIDYRIFGVWMPNVATAGVMGAAAAPSGAGADVPHVGIPVHPSGVHRGGRSVHGEHAGAAPAPSSIGLAIMAAGTLVYFLWRRD